MSGEISYPKEKAGDVELPAKRAENETAEPEKEYGEMYTEFKQWGAQEFGEISAREKADLAAIIRLAKKSIPAQSRVLEIGFGNGGALAYGRSRQWEMYGTEVNEVLLERARSSGFSVLHANELGSFRDSYFDLILVLDVLEHVPIENILELLDQLKRIAKNDATIIARFPNGDSPFARFAQHGDPTHVTTFGKGKAAYYARQAGLEIVALRGEPQPLRVDFIHFCHRAVANPIRSLLDLSLNLLFCPGGFRSLCSVNLVMVVRVLKAG